jgi:hypothetical protein
MLMTVIECLRSHDYTEFSEYTRYLTVMIVVHSAYVKVEGS